MSWEKVKLGDVTDSCLGKMLDKEKNRGQYQLYLSNKDVRWGTFDLDHLDMMKFEEHEEERYGIRDGDLIICEGGEPGRCAIWKNQVPGMKIQKALHRVRPHNSLDNRYLYYWFLLAGRMGVLDQYYTGATIKHLPGDKLKSVVIDLPPIKIQHRISDILSAYDDLIDNNNRQIKLLEEAAQRLYKEWFVDFRFPGHENTKFVDGVPEGWKHVKLSTVSEVLRRGISPKYSDDGKYLVINQKCIRQAIMSILEARKQTKEYPQELNICDGDIVICSTGTGTLGRVGKVLGNYPYTTFDSHVTLVRPCMSKFYIYMCIKDCEQYLMSMGRGSTNQQELNRNVIENLDIVIPTDDLLDHTNGIFKRYHEKLTALNKCVCLASEARDRLLPKLMSGEIEV